MNNKALIIGIATLMVVAAFSGIMMPVKADTVGVEPANTGSYGATVYVGASQDGNNIQFCSGFGDSTATAVPYANITMYEAGETPIDPAKTPDEYLGQWNVGAANGIGSDLAPFAYYAIFDGGAKMADWWPVGVGYYAVIDLLPAAYGGNHPTATKNYTAYGGIAQWDTLVDFFWIHLAPFDTLAVADSGGNAVLTWTQLPQVNGTLAGYTIYKSIGGAAWTNVQEVGMVGTWTDTGGYVAGNRYTMAPRFAENFHIAGRSNIVATTPVGNTAPTAVAGADDTTPEDVVYTFDGSGSTDLEDGTPTTYTWTFTDGVLRTLNGVAPTYTFATPGVYTVTLTVTDSGLLTDTDTVDITVTDATAPLISGRSPGQVAPDTAFVLECTASDYSLLNINSVQLYYTDSFGANFGPLVADSYLSVPENQVTKAAPGDEAKDVHTYGWNIALQQLGEVRYYFAVTDGVNAGTDPAGADLVAGPYHTVLVQVQGNQNQPHPLVGRIYDNATGTLLNGAVVTATWYDSTDGAYFTNWTVSGLDGLGVGGWYQIDIFHNNWTAGDLLWVNATYNQGGVDYYGYNTTLFASGDDFLPDDDKEYINVYIDLQDYFELRWTTGWNIWSIPMIRSENVTLGISDYPASWFANEHYVDTYGDDATLVSWTGAAYVTWIHGVDANGSATDFTVVPDLGYWAEVGESWYVDEAAAALPEVGILVGGQYIWRWQLVRTVTVNVGWNLLGWTSFATGFTGTDVIMTLDTCPADAFGINQPEIVANWTADAWESAVVADMQHYEGAKGYTTFVSLGAYGQSTPNYDFPVGAGYGYWVYSYTAGTIVYATI